MRDQPMRARDWNSTNERTESNYVMIKQPIPGFKITSVHIIFKYQNYMFKSTLNIFSLVSSSTLKKKLER